MKTAGANMQTKQEATMEWRTEQRKIDDLINHETNPRRLTEKKRADA